MTKVIATTESIAEAVADAFRQGRLTGIAEENDRLTDLLMVSKVIRQDALGSYVFANCDTLKIEYLNNAKLKGVKK